jgi:hypothetical protein
MATVRVIFGPAERISTDAGESVVLRFPFGLIRPGQRARPDDSKRRFVEVEAPRALLTAWGFEGLAERHPAVVGTLFRYALQELDASLAAGRFPATESVVLRREALPAKLPFEVAELVPPNGHVVEFDDEVARRAGAREAEAGEPVD